MPLPLFAGIYLFIIDLFMLIPFYFLFIKLFIYYFLLFVIENNEHGLS